MSETLERLAWVRQVARSGEARRIRLDAGLSLREEATFINVDPSTLARWETGTKPRGEAGLRWEAILRRLQNTVAGFEANIKEGAA